MIVADENTGIEVLYRDRKLHDIAFDTELVKQYNAVADELELELISDQQLISKQFNIPQHYKDIDVEDYVRTLLVQQVVMPAGGSGCVENVDRVELELSLYKARNLYPVLQLMIYIVDTMRKHKIVWGVGRGSSVASYVLYLIGIHKIDSIKYDLNIREFLK